MRDLFKSIIYLTFVILAFRIHLLVGLAFLFITQVIALLGDM